MFALLKMKDEEIQHLALEVLVLVTRNQDCVNSIAESKVSLVTIVTNAKYSNYSCIIAPETLGKE